MARGWLKLSGYGGNSKTLVEIIGETPKKFRIRGLARTRLAGRLRWLEVGAVALVPKHAIQFPPAPPTQEPHA